MNSITHAINGLASSLCFNVGLTQVAQKLDPVTMSKPQNMAEIVGAEICANPCYFTQEEGL